MNYFKKVVMLFLCINFGKVLIAQEHPSLMLTKKNIDLVRSGCEEYPLLKKSYEDVKKQADLAILSGINVPLPVDGGGGVTHEQHKKNYTAILNCGIAYQISKDIKYANYVKNILLDYASKYQKWPLHPKRKANHQGGRIFWQSLNDFVWQVYTIQGYDMVVEALNSKEKATIENNLFKPILKFFTEDCYDTFNKIHNHGTWDVAAVGMTGYVLKQPKYVEMALKGSLKDGKTGYLAQINQLFSPDGYYMEGPYYQRYALLPFIMFAKAINNYQPELDIFNYRDKLLAKAINISLQSTYTDGTFFPINDAIKDKTYETVELVYGLNIAYADIKVDEHLLDVAEKQGRVIVSDAGLKVAKDLSEGKKKPFKYESLWIKDGGNGDEGGLSIFRNGDNIDQQCLLYKAASQGMGHGHFDRLNILFYDNNTEVFFDYGAARFINIESKRGGHYLPENNSWAKQTVAHNTLVVDKKSHFDASVEMAERYHPELHYFNVTDDLKIVSANENNAYKDVKLNRTTLLCKVDGIEKPLLIDVFKALSTHLHQYDLPFWYKGQLVDASFTINAKKTNLNALGNDFGYQHIWLNAENSLDNKGGYITTLNKKRFYTTYFVAQDPLNVQLVSIGANDPEMNLLEGKGFILSQASSKNQTFISITETHGAVDPINETINSAKSKVSDLKIINANEQQTVFSFKVNEKIQIYSIQHQDKNNFIKIK